MLQTLANDHTITAFTQETELTLQQSSAILGIPESAMLELLDTGEIGSIVVGDHRMVIAGSLFDYDRETTRLQNEALNELTREAQEQGFY